MTDARRLILARLAAHRRHSRRGAIFVTALWITIILAAMVLVLCQSIGVEATASANRLSTAQADAIVQGAVQYVLCQVDGCNGDALAVTQCPAEAMPLSGGYFWILRPWPDNDQQRGFGITDEASKVNLNATWLTANYLQNLPNVTPAMADAIIDWRDTDSSVSGSDGAESDYYNGSLPDFPYNAKNKDFETVEELQLVRDVTKPVLFGSDLNRDGIVTPAEQQQQQNTLGDASAGTSFDTAYTDSRGLFNFVTVYSIEPNIAADGTARVNVNTTEVSQVQKVLQQKIPQSYAQVWARLQTYYMRAGVSVGGTGTTGRGGTSTGTGTSGTGTSSGGKTSTGGTTAAQPAVTVFRSLGDFYQDSGMTPTDFGQVADYLTTTSDKTIKGALNVNTAPEQALMALPGLTQSDADTLIAQRQSGGDLTSIAWVYQALSPQKANLISNAITAKSYQYSADILAVSGDGRTFKRVRVVVDGSTSPSRVIYRRDLTSYGWPLDPTIRDQLRSGTYTPPVVNQEQSQGLPYNGMNSTQSQ